MIQLKFALKDIMKNKWLALAFMVQLYIAILYSSVLINQLIMDIEYKQFLNTRFDNQLTSFKVYESESKILNVTPELDSLLAKTFDGNTNAYSYIPDARLSDNSKSNVVVGLGKFGEVFNLDKGYQSKGTVVLIGSKVRIKTLGDTVKVGAFTLEPLKISGILPNGASYVDSSGVHYLDNSIVILSTWKAWKSNNTLEFSSEIIENTNFIGATEETVSDFAQVVSRTAEKLDLIPVNPQINSEKSLKQIQEHTAFLIFFIGIVIMICVGLISSLTQLLDHNIHEYIIHRLYGATLRKIYLRNIIYIAIIVLIPFLIAFRITLMFPSMVYSKSILFIALTVLMICIISIYPVLRLKHQDMAEFLRRDI